MLYSLNKDCTIKQILSFVHAIYLHFRGLQSLKGLKLCTYKFMVFVKFMAINESCQRLK